MEKKTNPIKNAKLHFRPAPNALKIILIILILLSIAALAALRWVHNGLRAEIDALKQEAAAVEHENDELKEKQEDLDSIDGIQGIAREELGLVDPDTIIIEPTHETEIPATTLP